MKYLKLFENNSQYEEYIVGSEYITPNVSYVKDGNVYYHPYEEAINYVGCIDYSLYNGEDLVITYKDAEQHKSDEYIKVPTEGLYATVKNVSDKSLSVGFVNMFNDGPCYDLSPNQEMEFVFTKGSEMLECFKVGEQDGITFSDGSPVDFPDGTTCRISDVFLKVSEIN